MRSRSAAWALREAGALDHDADKATKNVRFQGAKGTQRFYVISANVLLGIVEEAADLESVPPVPPGGV
jgi:hypothetical protein